MNCARFSASPPFWSGSSDTHLGWSPSQKWNKKCRQRNLTIARYVSLSVPVFRFAYFCVCFCFAPVSVAVSVSVFVAVFCLFLWLNLFLRLFMYLLLCLCLCSRHLVTLASGISTLSPPLGNLLLCSKSFPLVCVCSQITRWESVTFPVMVFPVIYLSLFIPCLLLLRQFLHTLPATESMSV